jgi:short-subunit dehydrogenase
LVTGASGGIGEELARQAALEGYDVVLVARSARRLGEVAAGLGHLGIHTEVVVADLEEEDGLERVERRLTGSDGGRPVDVLVNNAGYGTVGPFVSLPVAGETGQIALNAVAMVRLTRAALPGMVARGEGGVLNVGSLASFEPGPGMATYAATKAFVLSFTESLREEVRGSGVRVTCLCPGFTRTGFQARAGVRTQGLRGPMWQDAAEVAAVGWSGFRSDRAVVVPGALNRMAAFGVRLVPRSAVRRLSGAVVRSLH